MIFGGQQLFLAKSIEAQNLALIPLVSTQMTDGG